jgi:hypothetical protein
MIFCSFQDRNLTFKRVKALWRNVSPHHDDFSEDDDDDDQFKSDNPISPIKDQSKSPSGSPDIRRSYTNKG